TSLRIGITYAVVGAIFAEYVGAKQGLGIYMSVQKNAFRSDVVLAALAVAAAISIVLYLSTYLVERAVIPWHIKDRTAANERYILTALATRRHLPNCHACRCPSPRSAGCNLFDRESRRI